MFKTVRLTALVHCFLSIYYYFVFFFLCLLICGFGCATIFVCAGFNSARLFLSLVILIMNKLPAFVPAVLVELLFLLVERLLNLCTCFDFCSKSTIGNATSLLSLNWVSELFERAY